MKANTTLFITTLLLVGLLVPALTANLSHGLAPPGPPGQKAGCCTTDDDGGQCIGCGEGESCITSADFCDSQGGFFGPGVCLNDEGGAVCGEVKLVTGCCVVEPGTCVDNIDGEACFLGVSPSSEIFINSTSCSEVPQCTITRNIPTMSNWGLIALTAVFVLVGIWGITRRKASA